MPPLIDPKAAQAQSMIQQKSAADSTFSSLLKPKVNQSMAVQTVAPAPVPTTAPSYKAAPAVVTADKAMTDLTQKNAGLVSVEQQMKDQAAANAQNKATADVAAKAEADQAAANALKQAEIDAKNKIGSDIAKATQTEAPSATDQYKKEMEDITKTQDEAFANYQSQMNSLNNGTFPLTEGDLAQIRQVELKFEQLKQVQRETNINYEAGVKQLGITSGRARYAGEMELGNIQTAINSGLSKIADIEVKATEAVTELKQAFQERNYRRIDAAYKAMNDYLSQKSKTITEIKDAVNDETEVQRKKQMDKIEQQKFDFEVYKFEEEQAAKAAEKQKPLVVAPGSSIYDPETMELIGTAPKPLDTKAPEIQKWGGKVHQWNPTTGSWETLGSESEFGDADSATVIDWANQVASGVRKFSDVPNELKNSVNSAIAKLPPKQEDVTKTQEKIATLDNMVKGEGYELTKAVGTNWLARFNANPFSFDDKAQKNRLIAEVEELVGTKALQALVEAKANGATFGALSEGELNLLKNSSTKFGNWARDVDGDGKTDYYEIDEKTFKEELSSIKKEYENILKKTAGENVATSSLQKQMDDFYNQNPKQREFMDKLETEKNPATGQLYTDQEKAEILGLTKAGGDAVSAQNNVKVASNIDSDYKVGQSGGQCGVFTHSIVDIPPMGNYLSEKKKSVDTMGIRKEQWTPKIGDVVITDGSDVSRKGATTYGHAAVVTAVKPNGDLVLIESNAKGDERITKGRTINKNSSAVYGALRGSIKNKYLS